MGIFTAAVSVEGTVVYNVHADLIAQCITTRVAPRVEITPIIGGYMKKFPAGEYQVPAALIIGQRKESTDLKTSLNQALRENEVAV